MISATAPAQVDENGLTFTVTVEPHGEWTTDLDVVTALLGLRRAPHAVRSTRRGRGAAGAWSRTWRGGSTAAPRLECDWDALQGDLPAQPRRPRRAALLAADRRRAEPAGRGPAVVHDDVRPRQHLHEPAGAAVRAGARGDDAARARRAAGHAGRRLPRRGSGPDPARDALRRDDGVRGAAALALLRLRRRDAALRRAARRVRALDRRPEARARARARGAGRAAAGSTSTPTSGQRLRLVPAPQRGDRPREPVLEGLLGLDLLPRRPAARASRGRPASCRATPTTRRCAARGSRARSGRTRRSPTSSRSRRPTSSAASTATSGSRTASTSRSRSTPTGKQVDALTSNNGHLLWSGIVDKSKAKRVVARTCMGPRLFSGWGVRTLAEGEGRYNPIGYHVGTVWPFDNSFIAWGLRRYGFKEEAAQIAAGILDAAEFFDGRLPEAFGGYDRRRDASTRCSTRPRAARRPGRPARRCSSCGRCSGSSRSATTSSSTRRSRAGSGASSCSTSPGRWGRVDAFGRGRVDVRDMIDHERRPA